MTSVAGPLAYAPWLTEPEHLDLTPDDQALAFHVLTGHYGDGASLLYSGEGRPREPQVRALSSLGLFEFTDAAAGGWERGTWGARLTCVGANVASRWDGKVRLNESGQKDLHAPDHRSTLLDGHPGCPGGWLPDGQCTDCSHFRSLDLAAYRIYLDALAEADAETGGQAHAAQVDGPQLYCIEHGYLRQRHVTTTKTCRIPGTYLHDGTLTRVGAPR